MNIDKREMLVIYVMVDFTEIFRKALELVRKKDGPLSVMYAEVLDHLGESVLLMEIYNEVEIRGLGEGSSENFRGIVSFEGIACCEDEKSA